MITYTPDCDLHLVHGSLKPGCDIPHHYIMLFLIKFTAAVVLLRNQRDDLTFNLDCNPDRGHGTPYCDLDLRHLNLNPAACVLSSYWVKHFSKVYQILLSSF